MKRLSYYRSADFECEGLAMDPVSRFGIGIISCYQPALKIHSDIGHRKREAAALGNIGVIYQTKVNQGRS